MPKKRKQYPSQYRRQIVDLVRSGRSAEAVAREFDPSAVMVRNWVRQADVDEGPPQRRAPRPGAQNLGGPPPDLRQARSDADLKTQGEQVTPGGSLAPCGRKRLRVRAGGAQGGSPGSEIPTLPLHST